LSNSLRHYQHPVAAYEQVAESKCPLQTVGIHHEGQARVNVARNIELMLVLEVTVGQETGWCRKPGFALFNRSRLARQAGQ
jgi:hypothetical protein